MTSIRSIYADNSIGSAIATRKTAQNNAIHKNELTFGIKYRPENNLIREGLNDLKIYYKKVKCKYLSHIAEKNIGKLRKIVAKEKSVFAPLEVDIPIVPDTKLNKYLYKISEWLRYHKAKRVINKINRKYESAKSKYILSKANAAKDEPVESMPFKSNKRASFTSAAGAGNRAFDSYSMSNTSVKNDVRLNTTSDSNENLWYRYVQSIKEKGLLYKKLWNKLSGSSIEEKLTKLEEGLDDLAWLKRNFDSSLTYLCGNIQSLSKLEKYCSSTYNHMAKKIVDGCFCLNEALRIARFGTKEEKDLLPNLWSQTLDELRSSKKYKKKYVENTEDIGQLAKKTPLRYYVFRQSVNITKNVPKLAKKIFSLRCKIYSNPENQNYCERIQTIADNLREITR